MNSILCTGEKNKSRIYQRQYYEKNRYVLAKKQIEVYLPREIKRYQEEIPEKMKNYFECYSYDQQLEKYTKAMLRHYGIRQERSFYHDCISNTFLGYLYSIGRCASCGYTGNHVLNYIKLMIRVCIICGINASDEVAQICKENNCRAIYLDEITGK